MSEEEKNLRRVGVVLVFVTLLNGINPIVVKLGITAMDPVLFTSSRLLVATVAFAVILAVTGQWSVPSVSDMKDFIIIGVEAAVFQAGMILALNYVPAAIVATMLGMIPMSVLLIHSIKGQRKIQHHHYVGAIITFSGVVFVSGIFDSHLDLDFGKSLLGIAILLVAQFAAAAYMVRSERLLTVYSHYQVTGLMFFVTFLLFAAASIPMIARQGFEPISLNAGICIVYGGIISLFLANILWSWGIKLIGSHRAAIYHNLPPVFALLAGILFLNEIPLPSQVLGVVLVLAGLFVFNGVVTLEERVGER